MQPLLIAIISVLSALIIALVTAAFSLGNQIGHLDSKINDQGDDIKWLRDQVMIWSKVRR